MAKALITDVGVATVAAGPVLTKVVAGSNSTFTIRNAPLTSNIQLVDIWRSSAHKGQIQITSPNLVPTTNGIVVDVPTGLADFNLPRSPQQGLVPQDALAVQDNGTAADVDLVALQSYYADLGPNGMRLVNPGDIAGVTDYVFGWPVAATSSATAGNQNTTVITTTVDQSDANKWYALLGYLVDTTIGACGIAGIDTSQLFIGGPGDTNGRRTKNYFQDLSMDLGLPCVPLFNAANKASTNVVLADRSASTAVNFTMILAQLNSSYNPPSV